MTQDQYSQPRAPGYVARDDVVPEDEYEEATDESKPMTRFQKVASALRGDRTDQDEADQDQLTANQGTVRSQAATDSDAMVQNPEASGANLPSRTGETAAQRDYWDESAAAGAERNEAVAATSPDTLPTDPAAQPTDPAAHPGEMTRQAGPDSMQDHQATEPEMFGTTARAGNGATSAPYAEGQPAATTIADVPAGRGPAADVPDGRGPAADVPDGRGPAADVPDGRGPAADVPVGEAAGRHAAAPAGEMRPGEAAGALGDFSDLTYGNLIPDAGQFTAQWQQIQFRFVDDPHGSVTEAADVVAQVTAKMEAAIQERQQAIEDRQRAIAEQQRSLRGRWGEGTNADTEALRETLRMYKTFLDQLIGPRAPVS
jgi:hypothetical protein